MDERVISMLRLAVNMCGYDFDDVVSRRTNRHSYTDLRSVIWLILQEETGEGYAAIGERFGWNRSTVFSAIGKAKGLRRYDREFRDLHDSVLGYYTFFKTDGNDSEGDTEGDAGQGAGGPVDGEA